MVWHVFQPFKPLVCERYYAEMEQGFTHTRARGDVAQTSGGCGKSSHK